MDKGDMEASIELFKSTNCSDWTSNVGWSLKSVQCNATGVVCSNGGRVAKLSDTMNTNNLRGELPAAIGQLMQLEELRAERLPA